MTLVTPRRKKIWSEVAAYIVTGAGIYLLNYVTHAIVNACNADGAARYDIFDHRHRDHLINLRHSVSSMGRDRRVRIFHAPYFVQIIATFVVWSSVALFFMATVPSLFVRVCPVSLPLCFAGAVIGGLVVAGLVFRGMARLARRRLLRHSVWLRSAGD